MLLYDYKKEANIRSDNDFAQTDDKLSHRLMIILFTSASVRHQVSMSQYLCHGLITRNPLQNFLE